MVVKKALRLINSLTSWVPNLAPNSPNTLRLLNSKGDVFTSGNLIKNSVRDELSIGLGIRAAFCAADEHLLDVFLFINNSKR